MWWGVTHWQNHPPLSQPACLLTNGSTVLFHKYRGKGGRGGHKVLLMGTRHKAEGEAGMWHGSQSAMPAQQKQAYTHTNDR